jgi:hypothetical protein
MASNGKKKTTMAKLNRERKMQEKRLDKAARKERRKEAALNAEPYDEMDPYGLKAAEAAEAAEAAAAAAADGAPRQAQTAPTGR